MASAVTVRRSGWFGANNLERAELHPPVHGGPLDLWPERQLAAARRSIAHRKPALPNKFRSERGWQTNLIGFQVERHDPQPEVR